MQSARSGVSVAQFVGSKTLVARLACLVEDLRMFWHDWHAEHSDCLPGALAGGVSKESYIRCEAHVLQHQCIRSEYVFYPLAFTLSWRSTKSV